MKRRNFIILGVSGVAAVAVPSAFYFLGDEAYDASLANPRSLSLIMDTPMILSIGTQYRSLTPAEKSQRSLIKSLSQGLPADSAEIPTSLDEKIKKDFENGNMILVDGWILSVTEARQCALLSLTETIQ